MSTIDRKTSASTDRKPHSPRTVAVVAGGDSAERAVSLESGAAVRQALCQRGCEVIGIDPAQIDLRTFDWSTVEVAFLALHGRFGEDGNVQSLLESLGVPYTGSDSAASRLSFSKSAAKERMMQCGIPTLHYVLIHESDDASRIQELARKVDYPLVVKPDTQGSSLGVSIVENSSQLPRALSQCFHYDSFGIMEPYIDGTEWTVGLMNERTLPILQISTPRKFYDYVAKYQDDSTRYLPDQGLPSHTAKAIEQLGKRTAQALGTQGIARVDIRLDRQNRPWVLEMNTIPGFTGHSLVPKAAALTGIDFPDLCLWAVDSTLALRGKKLRRTA